MATYLNVDKFGAYETLKALSPSTFASGSGIFDGANYFDTNTGTIWTVPNGATGAIQIAPNGNYIYVDNTGANTYADIVLEGERRTYITMASKVNNFYVVACGDKDDINGLGGLYLYNANNYSFILKIQQSTLVNKYLYPLLQPTYTWLSVPSISGKNGILNLSTLNDVNDGEPVETSDTSKFNLTDGSNVSALVTARLSE